MRTNSILAGSMRGAVAALLACAFHGQCQTREQTVNLQAGWNAVFLEVQPPEANPDTVFAQTPIDIVARYFPQSSPVQYITDPAEACWNEPGWGVWYAPARPESVVSSLYAIHGNKPYLVHSSSAYSWKVTGGVAFERIAWQADSFNLIGFGVNELSPPTFAALFSGANGRIGERIYRLDATGKWQPVVYPASSTLRSGEACWVYCRGKPDYQGPVEVKVPGLGTLDFGNSAGELTLEFYNPSSTAATVTLEDVPGGGELPIARVVQDTSLLRSSYLPLERLTPLTIAPRAVEALRLELRRELMSASTQTRLLKLTTGHGLCYWIPVSGQRSDLASQP